MSPHALFRAPRGHHICLHFYRARLRRRVLVSRSYTSLFCVSLFTVSRVSRGAAGARRPIPLGRVRI